MSLCKIQCCKTMANIATERRQSTPQFLCFLLAEIIFCPPRIQLYFKHRRVHNAYKAKEIQIKQRQYNYHQVEQNFIWPVNRNIFLIVLFPWGAEYISWRFLLLRSKHSIIVREPNIGMTQCINLVNMRRLTREPTVKDIRRVKNSLYRQRPQYHLCLFGGSYRRT